jgi:hypothetical protein
VLNAAKHLARRSIGAAQHLAPTPTYADVLANDEQWTGVLGP